MLGNISITFASCVSSSLISKSVDIFHVTSSVLLSVFSTDLLIVLLFGVCGLLNIAVALLDLIPSIPSSVTLLVWLSPSIISPSDVVVTYITSLPVVVLSIPSTIHINLWVALSYVIVTVAEPFSPIHSYLCDSYLSAESNVSVIVAVCLFWSDFTMLKSAFIFHSICLFSSFFEFTDFSIELLLYLHSA